MKKTNLLRLSMPVSALILEILPYGAVLNFANPEGESFRRTYSYFSLTPYGYANFGPFITALLTCAIILLTVIVIFKNSHKLSKIIRVLSMAAFVASLAPLLYGIQSFSLVGALISLVLMLNIVILIKKP